MPMTLRTGSSPPPNRATLRMAWLMAPWLMLPPPTLALLLPRAACTWARVTP